MTTLNVTGRECLSFTVSGDWAHFRRIDTTNDKLTYRVIPRTTLAGLVATILGEPRDSYYAEFTRESSAIAIVPRSPVRTMQVPMLTLPTTKGDIQTAEGVSGKTVVAPEVLEEKRQRRTFEYLCDPVFRVHLVLDNHEWMTRLKERLDARPESEVDGDADRDVRSVYTPCLGKSECLAEVTGSVVSEVSQAGTVDAVDSVVPDENLLPSASVSYSMERSPGYMERVDGGRRTTGFISYAYPDDGGPLEMDGVTAHEVAGDRVVFT